MKYIETPLAHTEDVRIPISKKNGEMLFFDIETTGFSAANTILYLIGVMFFKDGVWTVGQWFNDDGRSERELLTAFSEFSKAYTTLIHYNGDGFDMPYLTSKYASYDLPFDFSHFESIDIYKRMKPYKKLLGLNNLKLKTIEAYLGMEREDVYSGGELIAKYETYLQTGDEALWELLYTHNFEDIKNMLAVSNVLLIDNFFSGDYEIEAAVCRKDAVKLQLAVTLPKKLAIKKETILLVGGPDKVEITIPIMTGELKYFYEDYKNYYYLPIEDTAIHKSVAAYMDKRYRKNATKETCYRKLSGRFLPTFGTELPKAFGPSYREAKKYMEYTQMKEKSVPLDAYISNLLQWLVR